MAIGPLGIVHRAVADRAPMSIEGLMEMLRQEVIPTLRELRKAFNLLATGPYNYGTVTSGTGAPVAAPDADRAIYIRLDGGALTTLYVWNGAAWEAK